MPGERRRGGGGWGWGVGERGERDVAGGLAACGAVLPVKLGGQTVQGAGPHVVRLSRGVGGARRRGAALGGGAWGETRKQFGVQLPTYPDPEF